MVLGPGGIGDVRLALLDLREFGLAEELLVDSLTHTPVGPKVACRFENRKLELPVPVALLDQARQGSVGPAVVAERD